jgi:UDP-glucose 4-epimerase
MRGAKGVLLMRILVTGGAGFIGAHLARRLHTEGHYVRVLDNLSSGDPSTLDSAISFTRGDVRDIPKLWSLLQGVEVVFHLAALVSVPASVLYPREYNDVNVGGTVALLEACRDVGVKRVIFASSATVYGDQTTKPVTEDLAPHPAVPYAVSKLAAERYLFTIGRLENFETVALRIFNAYGPNQPLPPAHAPVIPLFMHQILGGGSVVVFGNGQQTRDFVYIDDAVEALVSAATAANVNQQVINVGSGEETAMAQLIERIGATVNAKADVIYNPERPGGIASLVGDLTKARQLLKYRPRTNLVDGLRKLYEQDPRFARRSTSGVSRA